MLAAMLFLRIHCKRPSMPKPIVSASRVSGGADIFLDAHTYPPSVF